MRVILSLFFLLFITACGNNQEQDGEKKYFNLDAVIDQQVSILEASKPQVEKSLLIDGKKEQLKTDSIEWENELNLFKNFDINFTKTDEPYSVVESINDGVKLVHHSVNDETGIVYLKVYYSENEKLSRVEGRRIVRNNIFKSSKEIGLNFADDKLVGYCVKGGQKMLGKDSVTYHIDTKVL